MTSCRRSTKCRRTRAKTDNQSEDDRSYLENLTQVPIKQANSAGKVKVIQEIHEITERCQQLRNKKFLLQAQRLAILKQLQETHMEVQAMADESE